MGLSYLQTTSPQRLAFDQSTTLLTMDDYNMDVDMDVDFDPMDDNHDLQQVVKSANLSLSSNLIDSIGTRTAFAFTFNPHWKWF